MHRAPLRLALGEVPIEVLPDGRVVVLHRGVLAMPDASAPLTVYPSLREFLAVFMKAVNIRAASTACRSAI